MTMALPVDIPERERSGKKHAVDVCKDNLMKHKVVASPGSIGNPTHPSPQREGGVSSGDDSEIEGSRCQSTNIGK